MLLASVQVTGCGKDEPKHTSAAAAAPAKPSKDPEAARAAIAKGAIVIDVRTPEEYATDHLPQATNIPVQELGARLDEVERTTGGDRSKSIVVYCAAGSRAAKARTLLEGAGYTNVINGGGLDDLR